MYKQINIQRNTCKKNRRSIIHIYIYIYMCIFLDGFRVSGLGFRGQLGLGLGTLSPTTPGTQDPAFSPRGQGV